MRSVNSRAVRRSTDRIVCRTEPEGTSKHINQLGSRSPSRLPDQPPTVIWPSLSALCSPLRLTRGILPPGHFEELLDVGDLLGLGLSATTSRAGCEDEHGEADIEWAVRVCSPTTASPRT
jgi:hypothetical protein